jgi:hypothetical protein
VRATASTQASELVSLDVLDLVEVPKEQARYLTKPVSQPTREKASGETGIE